MNFLRGLLQSVLVASLQTGAAVAQQGGGFQNIGIGAGVGAAAGLLQYILQHPVTVSQQVPVAPAVPVAATPKA